MPWNPTLTTLRNRLAALFSTQNDARIVVEEAGLESAYIAFDSKAVNNWHSILTQAELRGKVEAIVIAALSSYPGDAQVIEACSAYAIATGQAINLPDELRQRGDTSLSPEQASSDHTQRPSPTGTQINTGGGAYIAGNVNTGGGDFVGRDRVRGSNNSSSGQKAFDEGAELRALLAKHERNLLRLRQQKANYGVGEEPLHLLNQIDHEEQEIAQLKAQLA